MAAPLPNDGGNEVGDSWDTKCSVAFTKGPWRHIIEYGVRQDGEDEPCVCQTSNEHLEPGPLGTQIFAYQAAYALMHGNLPEDGCISHRCANHRNKKDTLCCTVSHMLNEDQKTNRKRSVCHKAIRIKANRRFQVNPGFQGKITFDDCPHGGDGEDEYCFIMYGPNEDATDSVERYILCIPDLDLM